MIRSLTVASRFLLIGSLAFAESPKSIVDLQPFAKTETHGTTTLVNLNPAINAWYLLNTYHLENANPSGSKLILDARDSRLPKEITGIPAILRALSEAKVRS